MRRVMLIWLGEACSITSSSVWVWPCGGSAQVNLRFSSCSTLAWGRRWFHLTY